MGTAAAIPARVGINGFGRMGRLALRAAFDSSRINIVHINELKGGPETAAHLLEFDSVHGRWRVPISAEAHGLKINSDRIAYSNLDAPGKCRGNRPGSKSFSSVRASSLLRRIWSHISTRYAQSDSGGTGQTRCV
jgi:hypothetical protein